MRLPKHHFTGYLHCVKINLKSSSVSRIKRVEYHQLGNSSNCIRPHTFVLLLVQYYLNWISKTCLSHEGHVNVNEKENIKKIVPFESFASE